MENLFFSVDKRVQMGKSGARSVRRSGKIPGVVYGIGDSTPLTINPKELETLLGTRAGSNVVFQLRVEGEAKSERPVIVKELQRDPMRGAIIHADFLEIRMDEKIQVAVPLSLTGESPGEKLGGTLSQLMRELSVECFPNAIPEQVGVDVTRVNVGDVVHVRDIRLPEGVDLIADADEPILTVLAPVEEEALEDEDGDVQADVAGASSSETKAYEGDKPTASSAEGAS